MHILLKKTEIWNKGYVLPDVFRSLEDWLKAQNLDLEDLSDIALYREEISAKLALANLDPHNQPFIFLGPGEFIDAESWLIQRVAAIREERRRRWGA